MHLVLIGAVIGIGIGSITWIEVSVVLGWAFVHCCVRPLLAALVIGLAMFVSFRSLWVDFGREATIGFFAGLASPYALHAALAFLL